MTDKNRALRVQCIIQHRGERRAGLRTLKRPLRMRLRAS
jgi:hypothetical protein